MSAFEQLVRDEAMSIVTANGNGATSSNVLPWLTGARLNLLSKKNDGGVTLPIWIVDASEFDPDQDWSVDIRSYRCPVTVIEIRKQDGTDAQATILNSLDAIRVAFDEGSLTNMQSIELGTITAGASDDHLAPFIEAGLDFVAGTLKWDPGLLCGTT